VASKVTPRPDRAVPTVAGNVISFPGGHRASVNIAAPRLSRRRAQPPERGGLRNPTDQLQKTARAVAFEWRVPAGEGENRWSPDLEAMHGIPAGSYDGTYESWKKLVHPEDRANVEAAIKAAQQTGDVDAEYRVLHFGAVRWIQAVGRMFFAPVTPRSTSGSARYARWGHRPRLQQPARRNTGLWGDGAP